MNYYPRYPADYATKTMHLTMEQDGAYTRMLDWCYANERSIPHDKRYAIARAMKASERAAVDAVLEEFFIRHDSEWINARADKEITKAAPKIEAARTNGLKGGRPKKNPMGFPNPSQEKPTGFTDKNPLGFQNESSPEPESKEKKKQDQKPCAAGAARFAEFWIVYPRHEGRKKAMEVWQRKHLDERAEALIADVGRRKLGHRPWREGFIPHAERYLRDERWNDEIDAVPLHVLPEMRAAI